MKPPTTNEILETVPAKTIITKKKDTSWFGCEYNMNLYRGCCHGCLYCDSRSDCYQLPDFDTVKIKKDAIRIIRYELSRKMHTGVVATGAMSDPYNPFEKREMATRHFLELINAYGFGVAIATKSDLIIRDIDILSEIKEQSPVLGKITITTTSDELAAKLEPYAPSSSRRFAAINTLAKNGIYSGILMMPVLPFLEDTTDNILGIVERANDSGAKFIYPGFGVTMRSGQREYFLQKLKETFPEDSLDKKYRSYFGTKYHCSTPNAKKLWYTFQDACEKTGMLYKMQDIIRGYRQGYSSKQLSFY